MTDGLALIILRSSNAGNLIVESRIEHSLHSFLFFKGSHGTAGYLWIEVE